MWRVVSWHQVIILSPTCIYTEITKSEIPIPIFRQETIIFFPTILMEFFGSLESEAEIPIPDSPARGEVPAEFPTKHWSGWSLLLSFGWCCTRLAWLCPHTGPLSAWKHARCYAVPALALPCWCQGESYPSGPSQTSSLGNG